MVISTPCGLWRYIIGDTVKFTSVNPYKFVITGRTKSFINAFGEELIVDNAEQGLAEACRKTGAVVSEYTHDFNNSCFMMSPHLLNSLFATALYMLFATSNLSPTIQWR